MIVVNQITKEERQAANDYMDKATFMQEHTHDQIKQLLKHQYSQSPLLFYLKHPLKFIFHSKINVIYKTLTILINYLMDGL